MPDPPRPARPSVRSRRAPTRCWWPLENCAPPWRPGVRRARRVGHGRGPRGWGTRRHRYL
eukprot:1000391-Lingulodinium_polyedra.AAC.1